MDAAGVGCRWSLQAKLTLELKCRNKNASCELLQHRNMQILNGGSIAFHKYHRAVESTVFVLVNRFGFAEWWKSSEASLRGTAPDRAPLRPADPPGLDILFAGQQRHFCTICWTFVRFVFNWRCSVSKMSFSSVKTLAANRKQFNKDTSDCKDWPNFQRPEQVNPNYPHSWRLKIFFV